MLNRRPVIAAIVFGCFLGLLMLASRQLGNLCDGKVYCPNLSDLQSALPSFSRLQTQKPLKEEHVKPAPDPDVGIDFRKNDQVCASFPDTSRVLVVMKTGASEAYSKVPMQMLTNLRCVIDFLFFGDMEQEIAGYRVHDSLDTVLDEVKSHNDDFKFYHDQKKCEVDQSSCNKYQDYASQGWALDKYKNIHIAEKTYGLRPRHDWYLFVDADTYVVWPTMMQWLSHLDPSKPRYIGSVAMYGDLHFGHGGSGYLVSRTAMRDFFEGKSNVANNWDEATTHSCCGDVMFAQALLNETGLGVNNTWPTINGEKPYTLAYGPQQWCNPIATMHHIGSEEISRFETFQREHGFAKPVRIKDIYHHFVAAKMTEQHRSQWDNMAGDVTYLDPSPEAGHEDWQIARAKLEGLSEVEAAAHRSFDDCWRACDHDGWCFQFVWRNEICVLGHSFALGGPRVEEADKDRWESGWHVGRIQAWVSANEACGDIVWPEV